MDGLILTVLGDKSQSCKNSFIAHQTGESREIAFLFSCTELKKTIVTAKTIVDAEANHIERVNNICSEERKN